MEGGSFERPRERTQNLIELLRNPLEAFDSPQEAAEKEHRDLMEQLRETGDIHRRSSEAEFIIEKEGFGSKPAIKIVWPANIRNAMLLQLNPITEGKGLEQGVLGYSGIYGVATRENEYEDWEMDPKRGYSLEQLFGVPDGTNLVVKPTVERWAIAKEAEISELFGENARVLYMGLGFLFLGHQWMLVGFHEAGHLPATPDENEAWFKANKLYAQRHKPHKKDIIKQKYLGLFDLLKKPNGWYNRKPTIGQIMRYGLVTHFIGGTKIPERWKRGAEKTMKEFKGVVEDAHEAYATMLGR